MKRKETFDEYQELVESTMNGWDHSARNLLGKMTEELGEIAELLNKKRQPLELEQEMCMELGDLLYQIVAMARVFGWDLEDIVNFNMKKVEKRNELLMK